jgi:hypothetical protein
VYIGRRWAAYTGHVLRIALIFAAACAHPSTSAPRHERERAVYLADPAPLLAQADTFAANLRTRHVAVVIPYALGPLLATAESRTTLAAWIDVLHAHGLRVMAPVASAKRVAELQILTSEHGATWFDGLVTELEFWNRKDDRAAAFAELLALVASMRASEPAWTHGHAGTIGVYLGRPTADEAHQLARVIDFVFLDYSVKSPDGAFAHSSYAERYGWFATIPEYPIFYDPWARRRGDALSRRREASARRLRVFHMGDAAAVMRSTRPQVD